MKIAIYQINPDRGENNVAFLNYESLERFQGSAELRSEIYDNVFEGEVDCGTLEEVYQMFNFDHPEGYQGRSLSVSDVVEIVGEEMVSRCQTLSSADYGTTLQPARLRKEKSIGISMAKKSITPFLLSLVRDAERTRASTILWIFM